MANINVRPIKINIYLMIKIDISAPLDAFLVLVLHHRLEDRGGGCEDHLVYAGRGQTSYLSHISQIISVEKILSCGEISDFCKEFEQFMEFYRNFCLFCSKFVWRKICVEKICVDKK